MNLDADPRFIEEGEYGEAWNIIINNKIGGSAGTAENVKGNLVYDYATNPVQMFSDGTNTYVPSAYAAALASGRLFPYVWADDKCIGWCGDIKNNSLYFFVCRLTSNASTGGWASVPKFQNHYCPRVFKYDITTDRLYLVYDRISLVFKPLLPVQARYVNNSIYFCNGIEYDSSELRHINLNISASLLEIQGGYEDDVDISWAKCPPKSPPVFVLEHDSSRTNITNYLKGKVFQFASRNIYYDGEKSVWTSISVGCPVYPKEQFPEDLTDYNKIILGNDNYGVFGAGTSNFTQYSKIISFIEYAFRETSYSPWKLIKRVPYQTTVVTAIAYPTASYNCLSVDGINHTNLINFYNDEAYTVIADEDIFKPFDSIPQKSKTPESVQGRMHIANNIEDFPTLVNTSFNNVAYNLLLSQNTAVTQLDTLLSTGFTPGTQTAQVNTRVFKTNSSYPVAVEFLDRATRKTYVYNSDKLVINTTIQTGQLTDTDYVTGLNLNGASYPTWVKDQFTHISILVGENNEVSFYLQIAIEHAYYVTGRDINSTPKFTKQIGSTYNLTVTPSDDYIKTWEAANQYQLSQLYQDGFNYIVNKNDSADYSRASEVWIDISNLLRYKNNVPYIYTPGDRLRLMTLGGSQNVDADEIFDYAIKEQNGRFLVIDGELMDFEGIDTIDYGVGNNRLSVAVSRKGDIYYSRDDTLPYYGYFKKSETVSDGLNKVSIQKSNGTCYIIAVGDSGAIYLSEYSIIDSVTPWTKITPGTPITDNINNITYAAGDTSNNFFYCGTNGLYGTITPTSNTTATVPAPYQTTSGLYDIGTWELRGIDVQIPNVTYPANYWISLVAYTQQPIGQGGCAVAEVSGVGLVFDSLYSAVGDINAGFYNDCVTFVSLDTTATFTIVAGGNSTTPNQGQISAFQYTKNLIPGSRALAYMGAMDKDGSPFGEITALAKTTSVIFGPVTIYMFYAVDVYGMIYARGYNYNGGGGVYYRWNADNTTFPVTDAGKTWPTLPDVILNINGSTNDTDPFMPIGYIIGQTPLKDIAITNQSTATYNDIDGVIRMVGSFFGDGVLFNYGYGGNRNTVIKIDSFESQVKLPILNYGALIEIYRPKPIKSRIYYESILGSTLFDSTNKYYITQKKRYYPILFNTATGDNDDIGRYVIAAGPPATISGDEGDSYLLNKTYKGRLWSRTYKIISMTPDASNITGNYINTEDVSTPFGWQKTNGRPNLKALFTESISFKKTGHRFSNQFLPNSKINGLSTFESGNEKIFPQEYIEINKLIVASDNKINGSILLSLFTENGISIYINRNQVTETSGERQLQLSDEVLGSFNTLEGGYGCIHPESVSGFNQKVWWWDGNKGVIVRYSRDGSTPLSDIYDIKSYARAKSITLASQYRNPALSQLAPGTYDFYNDHYIVCLREVISGNYKGESVVYDEEINSFIAKHDLSNSSSITPEMMCNVYNKTFMFLSGQLYKHNMGAYNTFFGSKKNSTIKIITNQRPSDVKEMANLSLESADMWSAETQTTSIYNQKLKQLSAYELTDMVTEEGVFKVALLRDINTVDKFVTKTGTITTNPVATPKVITGVGTLFTAQMGVGYAVYSNNTFIGTIASITSNTVLTVEDDIITTITALAYMGPPIPVGYTVSNSINEGDKLRGNYMITKLKLDPSVVGKSQLFAANVEYEISEPMISKPVKKAES